MSLAAQSKTRPLITLFDGSAVLNGGVFRRCSTYGKLFGLKSSQEQIVSDRCRCVEFVSPDISERCDSGLLAESP
jgi:hypothetical protein